MSKGGGIINLPPFFYEKRDVVSHQVPWTKEILETFITEALLTDEEAQIMRTRIAGWSIVKQARELCLSESTINKRIATLKEKYDRVAKANPKLPPRRVNEESHTDTQE